MAVAQDLLDILRCPYCVSGPTRKPGQDPGRLALVRGTWLICEEPDCGRKYPIKEDIPVMLIEEGDKWIDTAIEELPEPGKLVEPGMLSQPELPPVFSSAQEGGSRGLLLGIAVGMFVAFLVIGGLIWLRRGRRHA